LKKSSNRRICLRISTLRVSGIVPSTLTAATSRRLRHAFLIVD
jgi:hypothetical protein